MKITFHDVLLLCLFFLFSCKKDDTTIQYNAKATVTLENGYLHFKDYESFFSTLQSLSALSKSDRASWEKSMRFVSLNSIYEKFDQELSLLEKGTKQEYLEKYPILKQKYKKQFLFTDSSYRLNCSGVFESNLANKDGIVKIGEDFLHFTDDGIQTLKNRTYSSLLKEINDPSWTSGKMMSTMSVLNGSLPGANSFTVNSFPFITSTSGRGFFATRMKIYNINNASIGYRGFVSLECYAQNKNLFGTFRDVPSIAAATGNVNLTLSKIDNGIRTDNVVTVNFPAATTGGGGVTDRYEFLLVSSAVLKANPAVISQSTGINVEFGGPNSVVIDDNYIQPSGYWSNVATGLDQVSPALSLTAMSYGDGLFGAPTENYQMFAIYSEGPVF